MGADIKSLRTRIKSVDSTLHLTKAMGLVASSKIRRATINMNQSREYVAAVDAAMAALLRAPECAKSPYMADRSGQTQRLRTHLIVIAGDRGLAGGYNANVFRMLRQIMAEDEVSISPVGKRACDRFGAGAQSAEKFTFEQATSLAEKLCGGFVSEEYDRVGIVWTRYESMMTQETTLSWLLPLQRTTTQGEADGGAGVVFEPDELTILNLAVKEYVAGHLVAAVRESFASEVAARRCAMDSAGKNAQQMIDALQLDYNRARQGAITQELTEIVAGANA